MVDEALLLSVIEEYDSDEAVRRIILTSATSSASNAETTTSLNQNDILHLNQIIDRIITPRPWWRVVEHENHDTLLIHLDKITREWEPHIRFLGSVQYPPPDICRETPLIVGNENCIHPGWGAVFGMLGNSYRSFPYAILGVYVSHSNDPMENTAFIKGSDCPHEKNKWHCAFLPTTNCSFPSLITKCNYKNCIPPNNYDSITVYSHADDDGQIVDLKDSSHDEIRFQYQTEIHSSLSKIYATKKYFIHPQFQYVMPYNRTWYEIMKDAVHDAYAEYASYGHYILFRMNSWYRSHISHYLRTYRTTITRPYFSSTDECIAIHIRRGDRIAAARGARGGHHDMNEICYNSTHEPKLCLDENNQLHPCNVQDMYCGLVPFGLIELPRTLQYVEQILPPLQDSSSSSPSSSSGRNILLLSDDYDWILQETEAIKNDPISPYHHWNFYHPPPPSSLMNSKDYHTPMEKYHLIRSEGGTASGIYLQSTFQLVSQCNGFIGHLGSSFTGLLYAIMCHRHRGLEGVCPPLFDIKWDHEYYDQKYEAYVAQREGRAGPSQMRSEGR